MCHEEKHMQSFPWYSRPPCLPHGLRWPQHSNTRLFWSGYWLQSPTLGVLSQATRSVELPLWFCSALFLTFLLSYLSHSLPLLHTSKPIILLQKTFLDYSILYWSISEFFHVFGYLYKSTLHFTLLTTSVLHRLCAQSVIIAPWEHPGALQQ